jgi:hypothetical protein
MICLYTKTAVYNGKYLTLQAPGFQTNVRRIAVPRSELHKYGLAPEDEQRILEQNGQSSPSIKEVKDEWIPEGHSQKKRAVPSSAGKAVRKRK